MSRMGDLTQGLTVHLLVRPRSGDHSRKGDRVEDRQGQVSFIAILSFILITRIYVDVV